MSHLERHLAGGPYVGLAPIVPGESTTLIAVLDFDSHKGEVPWEEMRAIAERVRLELVQRSLAPITFRSSGGQGIHLICLWDAPQDAYSVRTLLAAALTACGLESGTKGAKHGEVEIFPKQDAVPPDGFGSMFILPFAGKSELLAGELIQRSAGVPVLDRPVQMSSTIDPASLPTSLADIRSALAAIPNEGAASLDYDAWRNVIFALHHATDGAPEGLALAHEFSSRSSKYDPTFLDERVWPYVRSDRADGITAASLFHRAREHGWVEDVASEFEDLGPLEQAPTSAGQSEPTAPAMPGTKRFPIVQASEFVKRPPPSWRIKNTLPATELALIIGQAGAGKSFLALDMAIAIALGEPWRGLRVKQGRIVYIAAEGAGGFRNRLAAIAQHRGLVLEQLPVHVISDVPNLLQKEDVKNLAASVRALGRIDVLVIDTFAQVTPGANENAAEDMGRALAHCRALHRATGATVLLVHHIGKDETKGARGWSGVHAAADAVIAVTRSEVERKAVITKMKDGYDGLEMPFKLRVVQIGEDEDGDPIESCVIEHIEADARQRREPRSAHARMVWEVVLDLAGLGGETNVADVFEIASRKMIHDPAKRDQRRSKVQGALSELQAGGFLSVEDGKVVLPASE